MWNFLIVALGGALGSVLRYLFYFLPINTSFPFSTLIVNFIGSFCIGVIAALSENNIFLNNKWSLFLKVGFCGGFTTFSTFSLDTFYLIEKRHYLFSVIYLTMSFLLCILGVFLGHLIVKFIVKT